LVFSFWFFKPNFVSGQNNQEHIKGDVAAPVAKPIKKDTTKNSGKAAQRPYIKPACKPKVDPSIHLLGEPKVSTNQIPKNKQPSTVPKEQYLQGDVEIQ
jgi:hypothetical protein